MRNAEREERDVRQADVTRHRAELRHHAHLPSSRVPHLRPHFRTFRVQLVVPSSTARHSAFERGLPCADRPPFVVLALVAGLTAGCARCRRSPAQTLEVGVGQPGAPIAVDALGVFFEDINFAADGGPLSGAGEEPLVRVPRAAHGLAAGGRRAAARSRCRTDDAAGPAQSALSAHARPTTPRIHSASGTTASAASASSRASTTRSRCSPGAARGTAGGAPLRAAGHRADARAPRTARVDGLNGPRGRAYTVTVRRRTRPKRAGRARGLTWMAPARSMSTWCRSIPTTRSSTARTACAPTSAQLLKDLHPGFLRFPGGCIVEGRYLDGRYQWKKTIGDPCRTGALIVNRWNDEFVDKPAPDYYQSFGLGFYEYFQLAEDHRRRAAADPQLRDGVPVQLGRARADGPARAVHPGRARSHRVRQRTRDVHVGQAARRARASRAVQHEAARRRQRAVGARSIIERVSPCSRSG